MCVAEFTDLSGNQVSLVILHLHGIDILLAQRRQRQKETTLNILHFWKMSDNHRTCDWCEQYLLFLLFPLLVAGLTVGVLRGRIELACILSDQDVYCPFYDLVPTKGFLIENLLLILVLVLWAAAGPLCVKTERWEKLWTCYSTITKATGFSFSQQLGSIPHWHFSSWPSTHPAGPWSWHRPWPTASYHLKVTHAEVGGPAVLIQAPYTHRTRKLPGFESDKKIPQMLQNKT